MTASQPPRLATWLLQRCGSGPQCESLVGDLIEQYQRGRSSTWYWRQVVRAILVGAVHDIRDHKLLAARALVVYWTVFLVVAFFTAELFLAVLNWASISPDAEVLRQPLPHYGVPLVLTMLFGSATGWMIARLHPDHRAAMVLLCACSHVPIRLAFEIGVRLVWPLVSFWGVSALLFVGYPIAVLLGGLLDGRPNHDVPDQIVIAG